jgi:hypothetical protein
MKRVIQILGFFAFLTYLTCFIVSFTGIQTPELITGTDRTYRFDYSLLLFFNYIPAVLCSGFLISFAVVFGRSREATLNRFSGIMFSRYRIVIIAALIVVVFLTSVAQILKPVITARKKQLEHQPSFFRDYMTLAKQSMAENKPSLAFLYAERATDIDPGNEDAQKFKRQAEILEEATKADSVSDTTVADLPVVSDTGEWSVYRLLQESDKAAGLGDWFNAHYYAQLAVNLASPNDINFEPAKLAAAEAWNKLSEMGRLGNEQSRSFFSRKKDGYIALMSGNTLKAYYIFTNLAGFSPQNAADPDIKRYLALTEQKLRTQSFFIDETFDLQRFENIHDMYFCLKKKDGSRSVVLIRGVTDIKSEGNLVRYLRHLTVYSFDPQGRFIFSCTVPYAKMLAEPVSFFSADTKEQTGLDDSFGQIPYILLRSVDRKKEGETINPEYQYADNAGKITDDCLILPMPYNDFKVIADAFTGPEQMDFFSLVQFVPKAAQYGFSEEVYGQALVGRFLYPFLLLIFLVFLACIAWNYRISQQQVFKFSWIIILPIFTFIMFFVLNCIEYIFRILNFVCVGLIGRQYTLTLALLVYILLFFFVSSLFLSRKN